MLLRRIAYETILKTSSSHIVEQVLGFEPRVFCLEGRHVNHYTILAFAEDLCHWYFSFPRLTLTWTLLHLSQLYSLQYLMRGQLPSGVTLRARSVTLSLNVIQLLVTCYEPSPRFELSLPVYKTGLLTIDTKKA